MTRAMWRRYLRFWGTDVEADVEDEIRTHLQLRIEDNLARGLSLEEARREAMARFGDVDRVRHACREIGHDEERAMRRAELFGALRQDLAYAVRVLRGAPGFTLVAVLSLALGIGANTAIFALVDSVVLRPLPGIARAGELVEVDGNSISYPALLAMREQSGALADVAGYRTRQMSVATGADATLRPVGIVSGNYFPMLGARAALGRTFLPDEDRRGVRTPVAVLGHGAWQRLFAGDSAIVGRTVRLNGQPFTVVGVMDAAFRGTRIGNAPDLWIPINAWPLTAVGEFARLDIDDAGWGWMQAVGRLRPGATVATTQARLRAFGATLDATAPAIAESLGEIELAPARATAVQLGSSGPTASQFVLLLAGTVGVALLIACANVASLLLARASRRRREISVRLALGAGRGRLVRQLLTESLVVALLGALAGLAVAIAAGRLLQRLALPGGLAPEAGLTWRMFGVSLLLAVASALLFGLVPALQASRPELVTSLKDVGGAVRGARARLRSALVIAQLALSLLLLAGTGLFVRSLQAALAVDTGYDVERLASATLNLSLQRYDTTRARVFYGALRERLLATPGVEAVSISLTAPLVWGGDAFGFQLPARGADTARRVTLPAAMVDDAFFRTTGLPIVRGRGLVAADVTGPPQALVVNETMARRFWPGGDALGQSVGFGGTLLTVVGIARDARYETLGEEPMPYAYLPLESANPRYHDYMAVLVRTSGDPEALVPLLRASIRALDGAVPVLGADTYERGLGQQLVMQRVAATVLGLFGALTLVLASVGIYGVMAYLVAQRTREIGIRVALGASRRRVLGLVLGRSVVLVAAGLALGAALALLAAGAVTDFLFGIGGADPVALGGAALVLGAVALLASWVPARRATRIEPTVALKAE